MKRLIVPVLVALVTGLLLTWAYATTYRIVFEAENHSGIAASMTKTRSSVASGGYYLEIPLQRPHGEVEGAPSDSGRAFYKIRVPAAGNYRFWALCHWYDGCGNSFFLKVDDKPAVVLGQDGTYQRWHWVKGPLLQLSAGTHSITIQNREDGAKLDQVMLTNDTRYVPVRALQPTPQYLVH